MIQERKEGQQVHTMGQVCAPHPCHNPSRNPRMRHRQKKCHTQLTRCDEGTISPEGSTWMGDITHDRTEGQQVHKMGQVCAPHPCHNPSRNPRMHCRQNLLHNRTHFLGGRKHDTGEWNVAGTDDAGEDTMSAGAQHGSVMCTTAPHPCLISSRNR